MDVFIVCLRSVRDDYEASAVVVAEDSEHAVRKAKADCSFTEVDEVDCEKICEDIPCVIWLT